VKKTLKVCFFSYILACKRHRISYDDAYMLQLQHSFRGWIQTFEISTLHELTLLLSLY